MSCMVVGVIFSCGKLCIINWGKLLPLQISVFEQNNPNETLEYVVVDIMVMRCIVTCTTTLTQWFYVHCTCSDSSVPLMWFWDCGCALDRPQDNDLANVPWIWWRLTWVDTMSWHTPPCSRHFCTSCFFMQLFEGHHPYISPCLMGNILSPPKSVFIMQGQIPNSQNLWKLSLKVYNPSNICVSMIVSYQL